MKKTSFVKRIFRGFGALLLADFLSMVIILSLIYVFEHAITKILCGLVCLIIFTAIMINYGYRHGEEDIKFVSRGFERDFNASKKLAAVISIPLVIMWIFLILSKIGVVGNFFVFYKLSNAYFMPIIQLFTSATNVLEVSVWIFFVILVLICIAPAAVYIGYDLGYKRIDIMEKIIYKKKS